jgi:hypothetical protein
MPIMLQQQLYILLQSRPKGHKCFFVSCDDETFNTYAGIWSLYKAFERNSDLSGVRPALHLPLTVPYWLRLLWRGKSNKGYVCYSSNKLLSSGFVFPLGLNGAIRRVVSLGFGIN